MEQKRSEGTIRLIALSVVVCALGVQAAPKTQVSASDQHFMAAAAQGGVIEVAVGKIAIRNGATQRVKSFGRRMVNDHVRVDKDLEKTASAVGLHIDWTPTGADQSAARRLMNLRGTSFDKAYQSAMVNDHKQDIAAFEREVADGTTPAIKDFAQRSLPTLKMHLQMAEAMSTKSGVYAHRMEPNSNKMAPMR